jgi:hypothetical protein
MSEQKVEWIELSAARRRLCDTNLYLEITIDERLATAITSGRVPVQGIAVGKLAPAPIDVASIQAPEPLHIATDTLCTKRGDRITSCIIDWNALNEYGYCMWPDVWPASNPAELPTKYTAAAETRMNNWFKNQPPEPIQRKEDVWKGVTAGAVIGEFGQQLSQRAFLRAWRSHAPERWKRAGSKRYLPPSFAEI